MKAFVVAIAAIVLGSGLGYGLTLYSSGEPSGFDPLAPLTLATVDPWLVPADGPKQPALAIDEVDGNVGVIALDQTVTHKFVISNNGDAPLHLRADKNVKSTFEVTLTQDLVEPGASTTLQVLVAPDAEEADDVYLNITPPGPFSTTVSLSSNDPKAQRTLLNISGVRVPAFVADQQSFSLKEFDADTEHVLKSRLYVYHVDKLQLFDPLFSAPGISEFFDVSWTPLSDDVLASLPESFGVTAKAGYDLTVAVKPGLPFGRLAQLITIPMQPDPKKDLVLVVEGKVKSDASILGTDWHKTLQAVTFGSVFSGQGAEREFTLGFTGEFRKKINLRTTKQVPNSLEVEIGPAEESPDGLTVFHHIKVRVPRNSPAVDFSGPSYGGRYGTIEFATDHPGIPTIEVPVQIMVIQ